MSQHIACSDMTFNLICAAACSNCVTLSVSIQRKAYYI